MTEYVDNEIAKSDIPIILLLHSDDHLSFDKNIPDIKKRIKELYPNAELKHIPLDEMVKEVKEYKNKLPIVSGELGKSSSNPDGGLNGNLVLIANCLSSYYLLKQNNDRCQNLLEKCIEPLIAVSGFFGKELNRRYFAAKGLKNYGFTETAETVKSTILEWLYNDGDTIHENYNSETGVGRNNPDFSWSCVFAREFIKNI